jgi:hypothetical protein
MPNNNVAAFPYAVPTDLVLTVASDNAETTLSGDITNSDTTFAVADDSAFSTPVLIVIDGEVILAGGSAGGSFTNCVRGFAGTTAVSHNGGTSVFGYILSYQHNQIAAELKSMAGFVTSVNVTGLKTNENLLSYSEAFENGYWTASSGATISATNGADPTGTTTARTLLDGNSLGPNGIGGTPSNLVVGQTYILAVYAKYTNNRWLLLGQNVNGESGRSVWFDIQNGLLGTAGGSAKGVIVPVGGGWYRCMVITTCTNNVYKKFDIVLASADNTVTYTGTNSNTALLWGAQVHSGDLTGPVTYVKTTGASFSLISGGDLVLDLGDLS